MSTGILLVQAFYQISCRHIENQQPEDSISNEKSQNQLQDLLLPLFQPHDAENVGNVLNIIPYRDRKRLKGKKDTPMTIILTTNLSKKVKKKGKKDVVIAVQAVNSYGAPLPDLETLLNLSKRNMTVSIENSESVRSSAETTNDESSEHLDNDEIAQNIAEDETTHRTLQKHNAKKRHHHAVHKTKKESDSKTSETLKKIPKISKQNMQRKHKKPKHIEINLVRAVQSSTADQLSTEEQQSTGDLTAELPIIVQQVSTSEQVNSVEHPDMANQPSTVEQSSTVEEPSPMELPSAADESSNIQQSSIVEKSSATEEPSALEQRNTSEELSTMEQSSTEEQLSASEHQSATEQLGTAEQQSSSAQLNTAEQASMVEQSSTAEQSSMIQKSNKVEQRSTAMGPSTAEQLSTREDHSTVEQPRTAERSSSLQQSSTAEQENSEEQPNTAEQTSTAEALSTAELINISDQEGTKEIVSKGQNRNIKVPAGHNPDTLNQSTAVEPTPSKNLIKTEVPNAEKNNSENYVVEQLSRDLEEPTTEKHHTGKITAPWGRMPISAEESTDEIQTTSEGIAESTVRRQIQLGPVTLEEEEEESEMSVTSDLTSEVTEDYPSTAKVPVTRHASTIEKKNLQWGAITSKPSEVVDSTTGKPTLSEVTQQHTELINGDILKRHTLEKDSEIAEYIEEESGTFPKEDRTEEEPGSAIISEDSSERLELIHGDTKLEKHKPVIAKNIREEPGLATIKDRTEEELELTSEEPGISEIIITRKTHRKGNKKRHKPKPVPPKESAAEMPEISKVSPDQIELIDGGILEQYILEKEPVIAEYTGEKQGRVTLEYSTEEEPEKLIISEISPEQLGLINDDSISKQYVLENKPLITENIGEASELATIQIHTEEHEGTSEEPSMSEITITQRTHKKGKKNHEKLLVPAEIPAIEIPIASEVTPEQIALINGDSMLEQYILENNPLIEEELRKKNIASRIGEEPEDNYAEELIPHISPIREYDAYDKPNEEPTVLPDAETSNLLNVLLQQTEINSLLNAQNDNERLDSRTKPLVIVIPNLDKTIICPDKEILRSEEVLRKDDDLIKPLNWDSNEIPQKVSNLLGKDILSQDLLNSKDVLNNENEINVLSEENDLRQDTLDEIISKYNSDEIIRNSGSGDDAVDGDGSDSGGDLGDERRERHDNQEISKQIAPERLTNTNNIDKKESEDNKEVIKSYNLSFTFNKK